MPSIPVRAKQWLLTMNEDTCMFPCPMMRCSQWELDNCPWWIDLDIDHVMKREKELYSQIVAMVPKEVEQMKSIKILSSKSKMF